MYVLLILLGMAGGVILLAWGIRRRRMVRAGLGLAVVLAVPLFFGFLSFWGEVLWFDALGFGRRFWTVVLSKAGFAALGAALGALVIYVLGRSIGRSYRVMAVGAATGGIWGFTSWETILRFWHAVSTGVADPVLGRDTGFYLFRLPLYHSLYWLLIGLTAIALARAAFAVMEHRAERQLGLGAILGDEADPVAGHDGRTYRPLYVALGALLLILAWGRYLAVFRLMYSRWGIVHGAGWVDVHVRLPGNVVLGIIVGVVGVLLLLPATAGWLDRVIGGRFISRGFDARHSSPLVAAVGLVGGVWLTALGVVPGLFQWLRVAPNEISVERPYLAHNIAFTRQGFGLEEVRVEEFPVSDELTSETVTANRDVLSEVRLWDPGTLEAVYQQFQAIRLYYDMREVDIDRYSVNGRYRQVMVSAREMAQDNLPPGSQTFVNKHFKYTHGFGIVMAPVSEFVGGGLPNFLIRDIPPRAVASSLEVKRPEIYYGESTKEYVVVNSKEPEFDYPSGADNVYARYEGTGGVRMNGFFRKFLFGWKLGGTKLLFSSYPTVDSRIMFRRTIRERVEAIAPFLKFDEDAYVVAADGRLYWIIDAYTTSERYPYSEPFSAQESMEPQTGGAERQVGFDGGSRIPKYLEGANYVRNAVKVVVDAYDGAVKLYVFEPDDPIIRVWQRIFPDLFTPREKMPAALVRHVRYPEGLLLAQGLVFEKYHMTDPGVFYNQEDLWVRATERYYEEVRPVDPYYVMWKPPGASKPEFVLMQPFTPKHRQVLIAWMAGMCDGPNYGQLVAYRFPKDKTVLGTQQVDTRIDQDPYLAAQIALWDQRGSRVIRGNVLVIPIEDTLLYVEPIYIQADAAAYPELRVVVLMHGDRMSYATSFEEALRGLVEGRPPDLTALQQQAAAPGAAPAAPAREHLDKYLEHLGAKRFDEATDELKRLDRALNPAPAGAPSDTRRGRVPPRPRP